jgi:hypothetical protein
VRWLGWLSQFRVAVVRSVKLVAEGGDSSGIQWKDPSLKATTKRRLVKTEKIVLLCAAVNLIFLVCDSVRLS